MKKQDCKILVVDDSKTLLTLYVKLLRMRGFQVIGAENGLEALEQFNAHPDLNLVISDVRMPGCDGVELLRSLRETHPSSPMVIMVSGAISPDDRLQPEDLIAMGADRFFYKPIDISVILEEMSKALQLEDQKPRKQGVVDDSAHQTDERGPQAG